MNSKSDTTPKEIAKAMEKMHEADELATETLKEEEVKPVKIGSEQYDEIRKKMQKPEWLMKTNNKLTRAVDDRVEELEVDIDFELDISLLFEQMKKSGFTGAKSVQQVVKEMDNEDLGEIVEETLLPKSYGIVTNLKVIKPMRDKSDKVMVNEVVKLTASDRIIRFDYSRLLVYLNANLNVNADLFVQKLCVNDEFFKGEKDFSKSFYWQDGEMVISITAEFTRI